MSVATTCYICSKPTSLHCLNPNCSHYFCTEHGDFMCHECHQQSQVQNTMVLQKQERRENITTGVVGVLIAILIGIVSFTLALFKEILKGIFRGL